MSDFDELKDPVLAAKHLASHLNDGTLVLFLGAGASKGFGLPDWLDLVNGVRNKVGLPSLLSYNSPEELQRAADEVLDKVKADTELIKLVKEVLYSTVTSLNKSTIFGNPLLIAVSALLMGSKRGHVNRVITLNYDNLLQWFLSVYGFAVRTVHHLPELEGSEDVRIYHPHGFIPIPSTGLTESNFLILGLDSANRRLGTPGDPWLEMVRHQLDSGLCLFIGTSQHTLSDRVLAPLFSTCGKKCAGKRPLGLWLLMEDFLLGKEAEFQRNNIIPVRFTTPLEIAEFLLDICMKAGSKFNTA